MRDIAKVFRLIACGALVCGAASAAQVGERPVKVAGWFGTTWNNTRSFASFMKHADRIGEASPFPWYCPRPNGSLMPCVPDSKEPDGKPVKAIEADLVKVFQEHKITLLPTIWEPERRFITEPALRRKFIASLVRLAVEKGYDGLDVDYEDFKANERGAFTTFITELGEALHKAGKLLSIAVFAKTAEPGDWDGPQSQDWPGLGRVVDRLRIMTYDYKEDSSEPGPIAPLWWFKQVLDFAVTVVPREKIQMGIPTYGYNWDKPGEAEDVSVTAARALAQKVKAEIKWDKESNSPFFIYPEDDLVHQVWYEDGRCLPAKLEAVRKAGIDGIVVWHFGSEDQDFWDALGSER